MRLLHTADWHLGQKFIGQSREAEQALALDWLLEVIENEHVDVLVVAGDIFDVNNPPVSAEDLYYRFLTGLRNTGCRHVVVVGGNHDSPAKLNAPRGLLRHLHIHVVGAATDDLADELLTLRNPAGEVEALVAAVPFLRDRDFRFTAGAEQPEERVRRIQEGIAAHYAAVAELLDAAAAEHPGPVARIATGHLFAKGASATDEQQNIYLGNLDNIAAEQFPATFDYVALGHIHRTQLVGKQQRLRYCGSLIPLSFSETEDKKGVLLADFDATTGRLAEVRQVQAPVFRRLLTLRGTLPQVEAKLQAAHHPDDPLPAWVRVVLTAASGLADPRQHLHTLAASLHLDILQVQHERSARSLDETLSDEGPTVADLSELSPLDVFAQRCVSKGLNEEEMARMQFTFSELMIWADEQRDSFR